MTITLDELQPAWNRIIAGPQRFEGALDPTLAAAVLDKETGLVWAKAPDYKGATWFGALEFCATLSLGGRSGWRLPTIEELASLVDPKNNRPALPVGHPFTLPVAPPYDSEAIIPEYYWSSSTYFVDNNNALALHLPSGSVGCQYPKRENNFLVWPVRGGQSHICYFR